MVKVLFVCLGNICRSPLAEALFREKIKERNLTGQIVCDSCGTSDYHIGEQPDKRTLKNAAANGLHINHKARQFGENDFHDFDIIVAMDGSNLGNIKSLEGNRVGYHLFRMRDFESDPKHKGLNVPDPYFGGEGGFQEVYEILDRCTANLLSYILSENNI